MLLLSLPWLLLALAAWRAARVDAVRHGSHQGRDAPAVASRMEADVASSAPVARDQRMLGIADQPTASTMDGSLNLREDIRDAHADAITVGLETSLEDQEDALSAAVETAKAARDDAALSRNSVVLARLLIARSARAEAAALLQSAALVARRAKLPEVHAEARIELADLARRDGDLTAACEHWQMAKLMFHEAGRRADQDRMADLMRQNRCPTDWVLTNF